MSYKVVAAGSGGQGVQFIGKFLATYGLKQGFNVTYLPSYGAEMRGGATDAQIIFSHEDISMPIISRIDALLLLSPLSLEKFKGKVEPTGSVLYNADMMKEEQIKEAFPECKTIMPIKANTIATDLGYKGIVNIPFIYYLLRNNEQYSRKHLIETIEDVLKEKPRFIDGNIAYIAKLDTIFEGK